jgi:hypothetical protein
MFKFLKENQYLDFYKTKVYYCTSGELFKEGGFSVLEKLFGYPEYEISKKDFLEGLNELFHSGFGNECFLLTLRALFEDNFNLTLYSWEPLMLTENKLNLSYTMTILKFFYFSILKEIKYERKDL